MLNRYNVTARRLERLRIIKLWINEDQMFSKDILRLIKEIRREQRGKSLLTSDEKKMFTNQLLLVSLDGEVNDESNGNA